MTVVDIKAPSFPESIADGEVSVWHYQVGDLVSRDAVLVEIETEKVVLEVAAPEAGRLTEILKGEGETVLSEEPLATFEVVPAHASPALEGDSTTEKPDVSPAGLISPAARKLADERSLDWGALTGTGRGGRITKADVLAALDEAGVVGETPSPDRAPDSASALATGEVGQSDTGRVERRVPMTRLRASVATRLVDAQRTAAMLTTFNEVDMQAIMDLRRQYGAEFERAHGGTRLGFMSFFVRASVESLKRFPAVNASIDGNDIVYHGYQDIGVAVSTERGLVVPVLRDVDSLTLAEIERQVADFGEKARAGKLSIEDMSGGTFTISNGGIFGSLLSTPILNPPQTGILGMHKIQDRPVVVDGEIAVRPMMYLALTYDHRLIDGQEAVQFLVAVKGFLEQPARMLLDL